MRKKFVCAFHVVVIISASLLCAGCGYKGPPVYKQGNKAIDYNSTMPVVPSNLKDQ